MDKLLVEFEGGGVCWTEENCDAANLYTTSVNVNAKLASLNIGVGIQDHANPENPFEDWNHLFVPYCSGDLHIGEATNPAANYGKGSANGRAAFDWVTEKVASTASLMVTGCSAGGFGAHFWAPLYMLAYPGSQHFHFGDSGMGVVTDNMLIGTRDVWGVEKFLTQGAVPGYDNIDFEFEGGFQDFTPTIYIEMAREFPNATFSTFTSNADIVQIGFLLADGQLSAPLTWTRDMRFIVDEVLAATADTKNFASYINAGSSHCIIPMNAFYSTKVNGVSLAGWLSDMVNGKEIALNVDCRDDGSC